MPEDKPEIEIVLVTDCGSTTTKAILFEKTSDGWKQTFRGESPTTVEKPVADVTIGARHAFLEVEELSHRKILKDELASNDNPFIFRTKDKPQEGIDLYLSTSSAGGGLQMMVAGVVSSMTTASAERAALGAGAIVMDNISIDDGREPHERVERIRHLRPDIVLIAGGAEGGTVSHPLELAETILQASPRPRFGDTLRLPVIYAANSFAKDSAREILAKKFNFLAVDNLRPSLDKENLAPARDAIHEIFLRHVMSHAPGYAKLMSWSPKPIVPTPAAFGDMVLKAAKEKNWQILAVDIGGATTDVFSVFKSEDSEDGFIFNRSVSANLGMSYSIANVLLASGIENIKKFLPFALDDSEIRNRLLNKMIRPTTIPETIEDLLLEQAVCREALRISFAQHKRLARGLRGRKNRGGLQSFFKEANEDSLIDMMSLDLIIGSGGVLSHAPDRKSAALMLIDAYQPEGITRLAVDSIFMMPHLGVLGSVNSKAATEVLLRDCLIELGTVIAPVGRIRNKGVALEIKIEGKEKVTVSHGELLRIPLAKEENISVQIKPLGSLDVGAGVGRLLETILCGGCAGLIIDCRGRPLFSTVAPSTELVKKWHKSFGLDIGA